ncbi:MAG: alanine--tRNA ligase [Bacteroidetes bacterium]|nr:alanine--tRNA ligase [Bacteroidota bacterium]
MTSQEIRQQFLDFFKNKDHKIVSSAPVVPYDDPTLLFTNAGMNQFKDVFLGQGKREYSRAADTQKCIRVSGKHNDLEEVGHDTYHHTFFEMLGNWSFGDYYKSEAITWGWELLTEVWKLPKERLWATVYRTDEEALEIWKTKTDINPAHVLKFDEKDNFWEMGDTGPCGPCSEIHINVGDDFDNPKFVNAGSPECIEIWNLVFIQYNRDADGKLHELPAKHVDTGMGFERVCAVLQNKKSNYDTDVFTPIIQAVSKLSNIGYDLTLPADDNSDKGQTNIAMRVIADHIRTLTVAITDGATPGNEGRGYVLRRILRRAARYGRKLDLNEPFLYKLVDVVVKNMSGIFPELKQNQKTVEKIIKAEEESFNATLDRGIDLFDKIVETLESQKEKIISGDDVFKLYDTFGFPVDLTNVMAREKGYSIDESRFNELMNEQKNRARKSTKSKIAGTNVVENFLEHINLENIIKTEFTGYNELKSEAKVLTSVKNNGTTLVILDKSPFYVESGGQTNDEGKLIINGKEYNIAGLVKKENRIIHIIENEEAEIKEGADVTAEVDASRRWAIMRNHSATHFLHSALRKVLGNHVQQSGSYVGPDRLRFDFTHFQKLSDAEINEIEKIVNEQIRRNLDLSHHKDTPFEDAKKMGALMFFGDKYGDKVNVVQFGDSTLEFCGGTHVKNSSQIGLLKIVSESSIASGIRRIEAVTGEGVEEFIQNQVASIKNQELRINELLEEKKKLEKELAELKLQGKLGGIDNIISAGIEIDGIKIFKGKIEASNMDELKSMGDELREKMKSNAVGMLISIVEDDKVGIVCVVSDDLIKDKKLSAGKIVGSVAKILGGGGGGRPHLATAGGKDISKIDEALESFDELIK